MAPLHTDVIGLTALILVFLSWIIFGLIFLRRKKPPKAAEAKRASVAKWGIALQACGFALVGSIHRASWWLLPPSTVGEVALAVVAVVLAFASSWWSLRAVQTLGKQWTYEARVIEGHRVGLGRLGSETVARILATRNTAFASKRCYAPQDSSIYQAPPRSSLGRAALDR